ncbi:hypothetical protein N7528_009341 [Penicillium herquei]|nr:hypothetical protein N7528_009341 [Penicillium herquei]
MSTSLAREAMLRSSAPASHSHASIHFPEASPIATTPLSTVPSTGSLPFPNCDRRMISGEHDPTSGWACELTFGRPDRCNVVGLRNDMFFSAKTADYWYDNFAYPDFTLLPTDIQYFIDFEIGDRARRQATVPPTPRRLPTAADYYQHQKEQNLIPNDGTSGLYRRVWFLPGFSPRRGALGPKTWHGQPANTLRHMFHLMGCPQFRMLPVKMRDEIRALWNLYFNDDPQDYQQAMFVDVLGPAHGSQSHTESGHPGNDESEPSNKDDFPSLPSGKRVRSRSQSRNEHDEDNQHMESLPKRQKLSHEFLSQLNWTVHRNPYSHR